MAKETLTITDNRTGKTYEVPITEDTIKALDLKQIHVEDGSYHHSTFRPWRLQSLAFKAIRKLQPSYPLWRDFAYEYENERLSIDLINGSPLLREWVDDSGATPDDLEALTRSEEASWEATRREFLLY